MTMRTILKTIFFRPEQRHKRDGNDVESREDALEQEPRTAIKQSILHVDATMNRRRDQASGQASGEHEYGVHAQSNKVRQKKVC